MIAWRAGWFAAARRHPGAVGRPARGGPGRGVAADLVSRVADLDPDRTDRAGAGRGGRGDRGPVAGRAGSLAIDRAPPRPLPSPRSRPRSHLARSRPASSTAPTTSTSVAGPPGSSRPRPAPTPCASPTSRSATAPTCTSTSRRTPTTTTTAPSNWGSSRRPTARSATTSRRARTPTDFASAIIWCKQFSHLFAVAPLTAELALAETTKVRYWQAWGKRVPYARKRHGGVRGQTVARRNSDSSHG